MVAVEAVAQKEPDTQDVMLEGVAQYEPAGHCAEAVEPAAQYEPAAHWMATELLGQ